MLAGKADAKGEKTCFQGEERFFPSEMLLFLTAGAVRVVLPRRYAEILLKKWSPVMTDNAAVHSTQAVPAFATCDLCDMHKAQLGKGVQVLAGTLTHYGGRRRFAGPVLTVRCYEDNSLVKAALESVSLFEFGGQRWAPVLVVDGGGSLQRALVGGMLGAAAARNGWAGVVVDGCVRDVAELREQAVGILARSSVPMPTDRRGQGLADVPVRLMGQWVHPGDWLYADEDGIVLSTTPLI